MACEGRFVVILPAERAREAQKVLDNPVEAIDLLDQDRVELRLGVSAGVVVGQDLDRALDGAQRISDLFP